MATRNEVFNEAMSWLNTPYHHSADIKGVGVDCAMFPVRVFTKCGFLPKGYDPRPYPSDWHLHKGDERYLAELKKLGKAVIVPRISDLVMFKYGRTASHSGIIVNLEPLTFIHAYLGKGVILSQMHEEDFRERFNSFWSVFA